MEGDKEQTRSFVEEYRVTDGGSVDFDPSSGASVNRSKGSLNDPTRVVVGAFVDSWTLGCRSSVARRL